MIFRSITALSVIASALFTALMGGFAGLSWLWMLPCLFAGCYAGLTLVAFLFFFVVCQVVDTDKPQEHDSPFYRTVVNLYVEALITLMRVRIHPEGLEKTPKEGRFLLVCNHLHLPDPGILLACFRDSQLAFISKRENDSMFLIGKVMHKIMCQLINRENDREALKTILKCIQLIKEDEVSIAVFPEGYATSDEKLHHFRSGAFKIAQKTGVPIVVCTVKNTQYLFKNIVRLRPTHVPMHLVGVIQPEDYKGKPTVEIADMVYEMMISDLGEDYRMTEA